MSRHYGLHGYDRAPTLHHTVVLLAGWLSIGLHLGCGGDPPPAPPPPLSLQLGTIDIRTNGDSRWVDLVDDQATELAPGAQGGFHVWMLYRISGNDTARRIYVDRIADRLASDGTRARVLTTSGFLDLPGEPMWELPMPIPSFMCPTPIGVNVIDAPIELYVRLNEKSGPDSGMLLGEQTVRVRPFCPPEGDPQHNFCLLICQG